MPAGRTPAPVAFLRWTLTGLAQAPQLFALALIGFAAREGILALAVRASAVSGTLGLAVLVLAPMAMVVALAAMFLVISNRFPALAAADDRLNLELFSRRLSAALVPLLVVYSAFGLLGADVRRYVHATTAAVFAQADFLDPTSFRYERLDPYQSINPWLVVLIAIVVRRLLEEMRQSGWVIALRAYLEVAWMVTIFNIVLLSIGSIADWIGNLQVLVWVQDAWAGLVTAAGPAGPALAAIPGVIGAGAGLVVTVMLVPLAWVAIGAVLYGKLDRYESDLSGRLEGRLENWPRPLRVSVVVMADTLLDDVIDGWDMAVHAVRYVWRCGAGTVAFVSLVFVVFSRVQYWVGDVLAGVPALAGTAVGAGTPAALGIGLAVELTLMVAAVAAANEVFSQSLEGEFHAVRLVPPDDHALQTSAGREEETHTLGPGVRSGH